MSRNIRQSWYCVKVFFIKTSTCDIEALHILYYIVLWAKCVDIEWRILWMLYYKINICAQVTLCGPLQQLHKYFPAKHCILCRFNQKLVQTWYCLPAKIIAQLYVALKCVLFLWYFLLVSKYRVSDQHPGEKRRCIKTFKYITLRRVSFECWIKKRSSLYKWNRIIIRTWQRIHLNTDIRLVTVKWYIILMLNEILQVKCEVNEKT